MNQRDFYSGLSSESLLMLHQGIRKARENDSSLSEQQIVFAEAGHPNLKYYGYDKYLDWKIHLEAIEAELSSREVEFDSLE